MPEGPSIVILKEEVAPFTGKVVIGIAGNSKIDQSRLLNQKIIQFPAKSLCAGDESGRDVAPIGRSLKYQAFNFCSFSV